MTDQRESDSEYGITKRTFLQGAALAGAVPLLQGTGRAADERTEVVVRAADAEVPLLSSSSVVDELKATAAESQQPIVDYVEKTDGLEVRNRFWLANAMLVEVDAETVDLEALAGQDGVETIHPNFAFDLPEPQAGESTDDSETTYGLEQIRAPEVWTELDTRGEGARVAVLDTGVDPTHPDVDVDPENFAELDEDGEVIEADPYDSAYHGTHVSATVVGGDASGTRIGVAPEATLLGGLVLPEGSGSFAQIIGGMEWAVENDADVINMSLGAVGYFGEMIEPVRNAEQAGVAVVSSSGNDGVNTSGSPANVFDAVAVGATDGDEEVASFSSGETVDTDDAWGHLAPEDWPDSYVVPDVSGPGVDVLSAIPEDSDPPFPVIDDQWAELSGTSMASPHVAGVVALMVSAAGGGFDPERAKTALYATAEKPDGSDDQDVRYGRGIVDAMEATGRFGADGGVEGTVTDADGEPVAGASIELDGFPAETDEDGTYRVRALPGTYEVTVDAFGYANQTATVEVGEGFVTRDFALGDDLAVALVAGQPDGLEAGESFDVEFRAANAESLTVALAGDYEGGASLSVDGEDARFGEAVALDPAADRVTVTVETDDRGFGELSLEHAFGGLGETVSVSTGPTSVYDRSVPVAVVDVEGGALGADVVALLESALHPRFSPTVVDPATALAAARDREHDAYVVQNLGDDEDLIAAFADVATAPEVGVVYLDQFGEESNAVSQVSEATGDPRRTFEAMVQLSDPPVDYAVGRDHPVFDGVADPGDRVELYDPDPVAIAPGLFYGGFHTYYEDFRGDVAGATLAEAAIGFGTSGDALGVDDLSRTVVGSSLGLGVLVDRSHFTADGRTVLANAVEYAARDPAVEVVETPAEQIAPGETASLVVEADALVELSVGVSGLQFVEESDLSLSIDGEPADFDDAIEFEEPRDGRLTVGIETPEDRVGEFAFDVRFTALDRRDRPVETAVTFRPTTVYESPLHVPDQLDDLQTAVDFVQSGDEVVVADGTYEADADRGFQTGLYVGTPGVTIRAAEGAEPTIVHARDLPAPNVINVDADDVTIEGLVVNLLDGEIDPKNQVGHGIRINEFVSGATVRDVRTGATSGVFFDRDVSDVHVEGVTVVDSPIGVGTDLNGGPVFDATITDVTVEDPYWFGWGGVYVTNGDGIEVTDCQITYEENFDAGILVFGDFSASEDNVVRNNTIVGPDDDDPLTDADNGIFLDDAEAVVEGNVIEDAYVGIRIGDLGFGERDVHVRNNEIRNADTGLRQFGDLVAYEGNVVEADTGVDFDGGFFGLEADTALVRYNDLSATALPFVGEPDDGFLAPEGPFDARLNYLGERNYGETITDGDVAYDPFLTAPPEEADLPEPTAIGTDLSLDPGGSYGLGIPGPTDLTIWDVLGVDGAADFAGDVEFWNHNSGKWQRVTGQGDLQYVDTLYAFRVTPEEGVRAVVDFQRASDPPVGPDGTPPGHRDSEEGRTHLQAGWNFLAAPKYGEEGEVFPDIVDEVDDSLHAPGLQLGDADKQAFAGYRVHATEDTWLDAGVDVYDPTMTELYEGLGLDPVIHEDAGPGGSVAEPTVEAVLDAAPDEETAAEAVTALTVRRIGRDVAPDDDHEAVVEATESAADEVVAEAPSGETDLVEEAVDRAVGQVLVQRFGAVVAGEDEGDFDSSVAETQAGEIGSAD